MQLLILLTTLAGALAQTQYTSTAASAVAKARATALTLSPTSNVVGKTFNRFVTIWLENTDYSLAAGDGKFTYVLPTTYSLLTYPISQPQSPRFSRYPSHQLPRHHTPFATQLRCRCRWCHQWCFWGWVHQNCELQEDGCGFVGGESY
jgi:hypothetical protein